MLSNRKIEKHIMIDEKKISIVHTYKIHFKKVFK
jgi:hypothetical protein